MYYGERFNGISHLIGTVLAITGLVSLVYVAAEQAIPGRLSASACMAPHWYCCIWFPPCITAPKAGQGDFAKV
jgi:predicted membrane channel-forming protein YqfA (hemolysin III family)